MTELYSDAQAARENFARSAKEQHFSAAALCAKLDVVFTVLLKKCGSGAYRRGCSTAELSWQRELGKDWPG
jgi:hypothetical protein